MKKYRSRCLATVTVFNVLQLIWNANCKCQYFINESFDYSHYIQAVSNACQIWYLHVKILPNQVCCPHHAKIKLHFSLDVNRYISCFVVKAHYLRLFMNFCWGPFNPFTEQLIPEKSLIFDWFICKPSYRLYEWTLILWMTVQPHVVFSLFYDDTVTYWPFFFAVGYWFLAGLPVQSKITCPPVITGT